ncbi:MAG: bifunctional nuclease domain-containing protein [Luteibaculaceae bacterium]
MEKIELQVTGLTYSQTQSGAYALLLKELDGDRRLPIIIGGHEAQAIAIELEKMTPSRPLTHDLFKSFAKAFNININEIIIYNLVEGIFFAKLICFNEGERLEIDARTSDAVALALRFNAPIYTYEFILESAGISVEDELEANEESMVEDFKASPEKSMSLEELNEALNKALEDEDYEKASKLRDEINKRKSN